MMSTERICADKNPSRTNWMVHVTVRGFACQGGTSENLGFSQEKFPVNETEASGCRLLLFMSASEI